jgi:(2R)-3-sulfolactate dehydrogenase (NADP+)
VSGGAFADRVARLAAAIADQEGSRLPGSRRLAARQRVAAEGIVVSKPLLDKARALVA